MICKQCKRETTDIEIQEQAHNYFDDNPCNPLDHQEYDVLCKCGEELGKLITGISWELTDEF